MKIEKIKKRHKFEWTSTYIMGDICFWYLEKNKKKINKLEKILFLMQHESLSTYGVPFLVYKTYIFKDGFYLRYLSDMLRILEPDCARDERNISKKAKPYAYEEMRKRYEKYSEEELNTAIRELIETGALHQAYFVFESYDNHKEYNRIRLMAHPLLFLITGISAIMLLSIFSAFVVDIFSFLGLTIREFNIEETFQMVFFGCIFCITALLCRRRAIKKPTKYEQTHTFPFTTFVNDTSEDVGLLYDDEVKISADMLIFDEREILTNTQLQFVEKQIFDDVCEMMRECTKKYPGVSYAVSLERGKIIDELAETIVKNYTSSIYVYIARNHVILERERDAGEWPGTGSEILRVKKGKVHIHPTYKEDIREGIEWYSQVYVDDQDAHYENVEESSGFVKQASILEWIDNSINTK